MTIILINSAFAAILLALAQDGCPFIAGAEKHPVPFEDPKAFDNTPRSEKYQEKKY
jgi:hypothetical protein